jgi:hypothetical protein
VRLSIFVGLAFSACGGSAPTFLPVSDLSCSLPADAALARDLAEAPLEDAAVTQLRDLSSCIYQFPCAPISVCQDGIRNDTLSWVLVVCCDARARVCYREP